MTDLQTEGPAQTGAHVVILVHGIRTRAAWYIEVRDALLAEGFEVELTNYGRFDLVRFLFPLPFFKTWAAADLERDIRTAMARHKVDRVSVIAHSFGTFIVGWILRNKFDINFRHIIFCGSVVKFRFPFQNYVARYEGAVLNEVGTRDIWPILAESVTWGYGSTGAFGFNRTGIFDRYHKGVSHSAFLNADFCRSCWIPVLRGNNPESADLPEKPPVYLRVLSVLHVKYIVLTLLVLLTWFFWCRAPEREILFQAEDVTFAGARIARLVAETEQPCAQWCPEFLQCQRCMITTEMQDAVAGLVLCRTQRTAITYRDPAVALEEIQKRLARCVQVDGVADRRLRVRINTTLASEARTDEGKSLWLCGCDASGRERALDIANRRR